jgi:inner membrane protein
MPNRRTHVDAGAIAGSVTALMMANRQPPAIVLAETTGGLLGGALGGMMPDLLEPATSPNHRKLAHSMVMAGTLTLAKVTEWQAVCRREAAAQGQAALQLLPGSRARSDAELAAIWWSFLAGFIAGFFAGYVSHLALDAATTRSLPFIGL